ncbi:MAG: ATP synthase F1 subunit delta [bacterium]|nr:ATP synthase F1 subunit delta [bacterium]
MSITISGKRYAQAILQIAKEDNQIEEWQTCLIKMSEALKDMDFTHILENPKLHFDKKKEFIDSRLKDLIPKSLNLLYLLTTKDKLKLIPYITSEYGQLRNAYAGIETVTITTAIPFDDKEKKDLTLNLEKSTGYKIVSDFKVASDIIGGIIIKIGNKLVDGSTKNKLNLLKEALLKQQNLPGDSPAKEGKTYGK